MKRGEEKVCQIAKKTIKKLAAGTAKIEKNSKKNLLAT
jgi:hypothetical protein